ncbi:hypothetical protein NPIL_583371 [Nephila pilipes]|uniref:Uncharacterized protein n=1 Tax=Nephila pilipes TaxID=299642 RepID=A0A8X6UDX3_NEPPI|nr:hypothetical protein NPIL_583371 [Nephila pilipes]
MYWPYVTISSNHPPYNKKEYFQPCPCRVITTALYCPIPPRSLLSISFTVEETYRNPREREISQQNNSCSERLYKTSAKGRGRIVACALLK